MNKGGTPQNLVPSHPGNTNAVKHGVHSPRLIQARASEIFADLTQSLEFSPTQRLAVHEVARCMAILEAIDRDLDEQGLHDKRGRPRYLLDHRWRVSRQLEKWLAKITEVIEQSTADDRPLAEYEDYVRALERIALGRDPNASVRDRLSALKELLKLQPPASGWTETGWTETEPIVQVEPDGNSIAATHDEDGNLIRFLSVRVSDGRIIMVEKGEGGRWIEKSRPLPAPKPTASRQDAQAMHERETEPDST